MKDIKYKGFIIRKEIEPWELKYNNNYFVYKQGETEVQGHTRTVSEAKDEINEFLMSGISGAIADRS